MQEREQISIEAPPELVWRVMTDVERWPDWTPTVERIERLDEGEFKLGSRARVKLKRVPASVWRVTDLQPGRAFTWETESGVKASGEHIVEPEGAGSKVTLVASATGVLATLFAPVAFFTTRGNVHKEAEGLKRRCELEAASMSGSGAPQS